MLVQLDNTPEMYCVSFLLVHTGWFHFDLDVPPAIPSRIRQTVEHSKSNKSNQVNEQMGHTVSCLKDALLLSL